MINLSVQRTLKLRLEPDTQAHAALLETLTRHTACFNAVCAHGWESGEANGVELHKATYYPLRAEHPTLPAQLVCAARVKATEALKSARDREKKKKRVSCPGSALCAIRYDQRSYAVSLVRREVSLASVAGRIRLGFHVDAHLERYLSWRPTSADLCFRKSRWFLHLVVEAPAPVFAPTGSVVGVDLGVKRPAVTSQGKFLGKRRWREIEARNFRLRRRLQAKGTSSSRRHLRRHGRKVNRFRKECDHVLSRRIVESVPTGTVLVFENLTDIGDRVKARKRDGGQRRLHSWSFARLRAFVGYKAEAKGVSCAFVDPRHTSRRCPRCGHTARGNRRSQSEFSCKKCGFQLNADLCGARNVRAKFLAGSGMSVPGGSHVRRPIVPSSGGGTSHAALAAVVT
jgi:IS605 OrfB family transposase